MLVSPAGVSSYGAQMYHFAVGTLHRDETQCEAACLYSGPLLGKGDLSGLVVTAPHQVAEDARRARYPDETPKTGVSARLQ